MRGFHVELGLVIEPLQFDPVRFVLGAGLLRFSIAGDFGGSYVPPYLGPRAVAVSFGGDDKGFAAAKQKIEAGDIGTPIVAQSISRDPNCPEPDWAAPANSGGMILDLAIHDFDMFRWLMGDEVQRVYAEGGNLTCPALIQVDDIDTAIINMRFANGGLGYVEAGRNCRYGYDIRCEIRGTEGTLKIGYLQDTPVLTLTPQGVTHDTVAWFEERFTPAYHAQLDHFIDCVQQEKEPLVGASDARMALHISLAATQSQTQGRPIHVAETQDV